MLDRRRRRDAPPDLAEMALQSHPVWLRLWWRDAAALLGITTIVAAVVLVSPQSAFPGWWSLLPTTGAFLLILAAWGRGLIDAFSRFAHWFLSASSAIRSISHLPLISFACSIPYTPRNNTEVKLICASIILA